MIMLVQELRRMARKRLQEAWWDVGCWSAEPGPCSFCVKKQWLPTL